MKTNCVEINLKANDAMQFINSKVYRLDLINLVSCICERDKLEKKRKEKVDGLKSQLK